MGLFHTKEDLEGMRAAGRLAAEILEAVGSKIKRGVSTADLNDFANELTIKRGAVSAPYLYKASPTDPPFPKHICTSVNQVVCHGIPCGDEYLRKGDIVNCDITVILNGYHGDTSRTFFVGQPKPKTKRLVNTTYEAMQVGIDAIRPGGCVSDIGTAIENFIQPTGFSIVQELSGHGIGKNFHEEPAIYHFRHPSYRYKLVPGMAFTVEPMINQGERFIGLLDDGWTIVTKDGKLSAQFEHTCLVTEKGVEVLTKLP